ncbi:MAG: type II CRISPR RNA-guided endonuclease Cas9 [Coprococcus eutactus]
MQTKKVDEYYVGFDIGTNSVGYAVTDKNYNLIKHGGEPMWGSHVFEAALTAQERRAFRTARRRNDRKKQRIVLVSEIFAPEIAKVDPRFFIRRRESALFRDDVNINDRYVVFNDSDFTDKDYYDMYPTIHHLIYDLMSNKEKHDIRLVYMACAYLVAHRGHFLSEVSKDNIDSVLDFDAVYNNFLSIMENLAEIPWECDISKFKEILKKKQTVTNKERDFLQLLNEGKKFKTSEEDDVSREGLVKLLSGGTYELGKLFPKLTFEEKVSVSFNMTEEDFAMVLQQLGDEGDIISSLRNVYDWATLSDVLNGKNSVSEGKITVYEQHKKDLSFLKYFVKKYIPNRYYEVFRDGNIVGNYVSYSYNLKNVQNVSKFKGAKKDAFCDYIKKVVKDIKVDDEDKVEYEDMMFRLDTYSFMPKQVENDNRVIPYQLHYYELKKILDNASSYLEFLDEKDMDGYTSREKLLSIMEFRIPYYVGPLRTDNGQHGWMKRKTEGRIYPWNFEDKVDLDASEQEFINRMTNSCTYLPGETVVPKYSLLYCKFNVLNEINNIKINDCSIPIEHKQEIYKLFERYRKVTPKKIKDYLVSNNLLHPEDVISGIDVTIKSSLKSYHDFKKMLESGVLKEKQVEAIIERLTYSEDKGRIIRWLHIEFPDLSDDDVKYISKLKYSDFGRLSRKLLVGIRGCNKDTGEVDSIMGMLWSTNDNMMKLLSNSYTFVEEIEAIKNEYYVEHPANLDSMLDEMYVSNAVRRPIHRTLDILSDIRKVCGKNPSKIFVEMARGGGEKGVRTKSRRDQISELYKNMDKAEVRELSEQLEGKTDNELQSEVLFLYFMQLGKCAYTQKTIDIDKLKTNIYNVDHIYPQSYVKDDSITNKVLVISEENGQKGDKYLISKDIREKMQPFWYRLLSNKLISEEKYRRLTRCTSFTEEELTGFINRQLVETHQSTKAVTTVFRTLFPDVEIVYSKAGLVSDFRKEFDMLKTRSVNDLHHAKDAYLNIVVGNVYHCKFTKNFYVTQKYSLKTKTLFTHNVKSGDVMIWDGQESIGEIRKVLTKNNIHYTKYSFMRKGKLFAQNPIKAKEGLIPRKEGLSSEKYGGYSDTTATAFLLVKFRDRKGTDAMIIPIDLMYSNKVFSDKKYAIAYAKDRIKKIWGMSEGQITDVTLPLGLRMLKINTMLSFDGFKSCITGKASLGKQLGLTSMMPLVIGNEWENYVKKIDRFIEKKQNNKKLLLNTIYDNITKEKNEQLYQILVNKVVNGIYNSAFKSQIKILKNGHEIFNKLELEEQVMALANIILLLKSGRAGNCDMTLLGGSKKAGTYVCSTKISNLQKNYKEVWLIDSSASGIYESKVCNLLEVIE